MKSNKLPQSTGTALLIGGGLFTIVVLLWPICMVLSQTKGDLTQQLLAISEIPKSYTLNFIIASLIAPAISFIMLTLAFFIKTRKETPILNILGTLFLMPYVTLVSITYTSQITLLQGFITEGKLAEAEIWYIGNRNSIPYFVNQLGYTFFALSALLIGFKLLYEKGMPKAVGILLWLSGFLSIIAFLGLIIKNEVINSSTILSGLLTVPIGIIVILWGVKLRREMKND